jgi:tetratricopeptide (TPR) repeat protein
MPELEAEHAAPTWPTWRAVGAGVTRHGANAEGTADASGFRSTAAAHTNPEARLKSRSVGSTTPTTIRDVSLWTRDGEVRRRSRSTREFHPTSSTPPDAVRQVATEIFDRMRGAWEVIQNETERAKYTDRVIHGKKSDEEEAMEKVEAYYRAETNFKRGHAAFTNGRTIEAHNFFKQAVEDCPEEYEFLVYYGYTLFFTSRIKDPQMAAQGLGLIQKVLRENEKQRQARQRLVLLGRAYATAGDFNDALKAFKTAYELNPGNAEAKRQYQRTKEQMDAARAPRVPVAGLRKRRTAARR